METKSWWQSKTILGAIMTVIAVALQGFGFTFGAEDQTILVNAIYAALEVGGSIFAVYGRVKASKSIG